MGKKEAIVNGDNGFQNALYDASNYQTIEKQPERISRLKPYIYKYNWEGIPAGQKEFPAGQKDWQNMKEIIRQLRLMYYIYHAIQKQKVLHIDQNITTSVKNK